MTTQRQIEANQQNALKSTGPKTDEGKSKSSANAVKHGLTARTLIFLEQENPADFEELLSEMQAEFDPTVGLQSQLVYQIAATTWRLERASKLEVILMRDPMASSVPSNDTSVPVLPGQREWSWLRNYVFKNDILGKLSRYEASLVRQLMASLKMLNELREKE